MSRREPIAPATIAQVLLAILLAVAAATLIAGVRRTTPVGTQDFMVDGAPQDPAEIRACRRAPGTPTLPGPDVSFGDTESIGLVRSFEVVSCPTDFDGRVVDYMGEVVGDVLHRSDGAWVLMNDDPYSLEVGPLHVSGTPSGTNSGLAVWLPGDLSDVITQAGNARWRGTVLRVTGELRRADPQDGGGLTLRARQVEVAAEAIPIDNPLNVPQAVAAAILLSAAGTSLVLDRLRARSR